MVNVLLELELFKNRNRKRRRFARARPGLAHNIDFFQRKRNQPRLNRRRILVSSLFQGVEHDVREAEAFKADFWWFAILQNWFSNSDSMKMTTVNSYPLSVYDDLVRLCSRHFREKITA